MSWRLVFAKLLSFLLGLLGAALFTRGLLAQAPGTQQTAALGIPLKRGVRLRVQINDPSGYLATHEGKIAGAHLLIGVWTSNGLFHTAQILTKGGASRICGLVIPYVTPLKLSLQSMFFNLADEKRAPVPKLNTGTPFQVASQGQPTPFRFTVTGVESK